MISLNLLPDVKKNLISIRRQRNMIMSIGMVTIIVCLVVLAILGVSYGALIGIGSVTRGNIDANAAKIKQAQSSKQLDRYLTVQNQLKQLGSLKQSQPMYSRIFDYMNALNPPAPNQVKISKVDVANESGTGATVTLSGTTGEFRSLEVYRKVLEKAKLKYANTDNESQMLEKLLFTAVEAPNYSSSFSTDGWQISFTIKATFTAEAFSNSITKQTVETPKGSLEDEINKAPTYDPTSTGGGSTGGAASSTSGTPTESTPTTDLSTSGSEANSSTGGGE